jgi:hypothetical protein
MNTTEIVTGTWESFIETLGLDGAALELLRNSQPLVAEICEHEDHGTSAWVAVDLQNTAVRMLAVPAVVEKIAHALGQKLGVYTHFEIRCREQSVAYMVTTLHPSKLQRH